MGMKFSPKWSSDLIFQDFINTIVRKSVWCNPALLKGKVSKNRLEIECWSFINNIEFDEFRRNPVGSAISFKQSRAEGEQQSGVEPVPEDRYSFGLVGGGWEQVESVGVGMPGKPEMIKNIKEEKDNVERYL